MKTAYKFILRTYVGPMILTFFIVMFILLMHFLWMKIDQLMGKGLSGAVIAELVMYAAATLIPMALPLATLLASIMTLGNLGENNELLALKAAGVSLPRIMKPLTILIIVVSISSFFVINNLTPYSYQQMFSLMSDIRRQKQEMKFQDGIFFNGIEDMSIRVGKQNPKTNLLTDVLIYNNKEYSKMQTFVADSGYIKISDDRKFLIVRLFNGHIYEENRDYDWYTKNKLTHHIFDEQQSLLPLEGFAFERGDMEGFSSNAETKNITQLTQTIDSLKYTKDSIVSTFSERFTRGYVFKNYGHLASLDTIPEKPGMYIVNALDTMNVTDRSRVLGMAAQAAKDAQNFVNYEVRFATYTSGQLYKAQYQYQNKLALPFSILIFFLIGAPLGAIIRKGGLGMPIVVSVAFFVIYYIISITGRNMAEDGSWLPFIGVWLPSFVLFPIAVFLTYKSANDSALFNADAYRLKIKQLTAFVSIVKNKFTKIKK